MPFLTDLDLRAHEPGEWVMLSTLEYRSTGRWDDVYYVPAGFVTDLASIPHPFRGLIDRNGPSRRAAVLHDWLYCYRITTRAEADALFLEALGADGVGWTTRHAMWLAVRAGGWIYWNRRTEGLNDDDFA